MHPQSLESWRHDHVFLGADHGRNERRTWIVVALTAVTMVVEIVAGFAFGSMALLADGWHMATHAGALAIAAFAYRYARRHAGDARFTFGTGKLGDLAGFASAVVLAIIALLIGVESGLRLLAPVAIAFDEAMAVAFLGLAVNLLCAWILRHDDHHHHHDHGGHHHGHDHDVHAQEHAHRDHNLRGAYLHVLADALTSILAIAALLLGSIYGWVWLDAAIGIVGALVIARWSWSLMRDSGAVLLDAAPPASLTEAIRARLETGDDRVADLHVWRVGPGHHAAIVSLVTHAPLAADAYKSRLADIAGLSHVTVEINACA
jgi:cation diffusion facilitator family transporter